MLPAIVKKMACAAALATAAALVATAPAQAAAPLAKTPAPGFFRMMLGDFEITALNDGTFAMPADKLLQQPAEKTTDALAKSFLKVPVETSVNGFLVDTGSKLVLVDAGAGSFFGPTLGKLAANLKASGYEPAQVDEIYITHLHVDHVGGLVTGSERVFPNATVRVDKRDADYWLSETNLERAPASTKDFFKGAMTSLKPYQAADKLKTFDGSGQLVPGVKALASHGHTPGHTSYVVESNGKKLFLLGDLILVAAVQLEHPSVTIAFDVDPKAAIKARDKVFSQAAKEGALAGAAHIAFPGLGHLRKSRKSYQWVPVNFTQMN